MSEARIMELQVSIKSLPIYQGTTSEAEVNRAISLLNKGVSQGGKAYEVAVFKIAKYLLFHCNYSNGYANSTLRKWTLEKCSPELYDSNRYNKIIEQVCRRICYGKLEPKAATIRNTELSEADLKEIVTVEKKTLCILYGILYQHCKMYGDESGKFYMTYEQISNAGAGRNRTRLKKQIEELVFRGKVEIIRSNFTPSGRMEKSPK